MCLRIVAYVITVCWRRVGGLIEWDPASLKPGSQGEFLSDVLKSKSNSPQQVHGRQNADEGEELP